MSYQLRCDPVHGCGGALDYAAATPVQLVAIVFARSLVDRELVLHHRQIAKRCRGCGIVNIFVPVQTGIATKGAASL